MLCILARETLVLRNNQIGIDGNRDVVPALSSSRRDLLIEFRLNTNPILKRNAVPRSTYTSPLLMRVP